MLYVRAVARAASQIVLFCLGLWGLQVTLDLGALILAATFIGAVNFGIALYDERKKDAAELRARDDRNTLKDLQSHVVKLVGPSEIPPHLQDLSRLSSSDLRALVHSVSQRLRAFAEESGEGRYSEPVWQVVPGYDAMSEEDQNRHWHDQNRRDIEAHTDRTARFLRECRPDALALWQELKSRIAMPKDVRELWSGALETSSLAGPRPIEEVATALETAARRLAD